MEKITETQLKDKVNSLREYLTAYENENQLLAENPYSGADAEKFARLSPEDQAWYTKGGGKPDINDPYIARRAPNKGKLGPAPAAAPVNNASSSYTANQGVQAQGDDEGNTMITRPDGSTMVVGPDGNAIPPGGGKEIPANNATSSYTGQATPAAQGPQATKIARFKELLAKAKAPGASASSGGATSPYALSANGAKLKANEGTTYFLTKLRLIENQQLNEVLTPEEQKEMDALSAELGQQGAEADPELSALINDYNSLKASAPGGQETPANNATSSYTGQTTPVAPAAPAAPAQAASVTASGPVTWKQIYDLNKDVIGANPNLIKPKQQLKMPDGSTYTVKPGDNLSKIAKNAGGGQGASVTPAAPAAQSPEQLAAAQKSNGVDPATGQNVSMKDPATGQMINPENGLPVAPAAPARAANAPLPAGGMMTGKDMLGRPVMKGSPNDVSPKQRTAESVGYNELQRIVSLINHR